MNRFGWDDSSAAPGSVGICARCVHLDRKGLGCKAYPDGIPRAVLLGELDHRKPIDGDRGIQFEERKATT